MTPTALAEYLYLHMPLSRAMAVSVIEASAESVALHVPLEPNVNVHGTMFGGSISTAMLLAAWSVLHLRLEANVTCDLVVQRNQTDFLKPVSGPAQAIAHLDDADWAGFIQQLKRHGKARRTVSATLVFEDAIAARFTGEFVAIGTGR
ncbi:YiiD C-terminal domain-containing protein [uncultured Devosia sp.]|uniref:YiiD C-terminal domain-containing protein n=1 Tax=uncultured Devosia sp. TaxID=211434 RepID=UPI0026255419|nr:YiiD C-terminal domain-containing protein [uncultured Devosia sp.]